MIPVSRFSGFSLVEILVSLFVVSLAAVNVSGLQKMVIDQNRNNVAHSAVIELAISKMEALLKSVDIDTVDALNAKSESDILGLQQTQFTSVWKVSADLGSEVGEGIREVQLKITWRDAKGEKQTFTYSELVHLNTQLIEGELSYPVDIIISLLESNDIIYFEPKIDYKKGAFVIYNSELYEATAFHSIGKGRPHDVIDPNANSGWKNYGPINNPALATNVNLTTLFAD
ncbi:type IV pilus modification PilV family protein [Psychromonas antarctica]|uniref:type IV pilus modification PilV family protein n=1 Tax=Psychromonas antarctica TaxID=67573 RepID=UPI001EE87798|nr:hypothetical protein [Psychromonas antarctica]MCG6200167.1 hypothetical protein [Psychromonas antarctica]